MNKGCSNYFPPMILVETTRAPTAMNTGINVTIVAERPVKLEVVITCCETGIPTPTIRIIAMITTNTEPPICPFLPIFCIFNFHSPYIN